MRLRTRNCLIVSQASGFSSTETGEGDETGEGEETSQTVPTWPPSTSQLSLRPFEKLLQALQLRTSRGLLKEGRRSARWAVFRKRWTSCKAVVIVRALYLANKSYFNTFYKELLTVSHIFLEVRTSSVAKR